MHHSRRRRGQSQHLPASSLPCPPLTSLDLPILASLRPVASRRLISSHEQSHTYKWPYRRVSRPLSSSTATVEKEALREPSFRQRTPHNGWGREGLGLATGWPWRILVPLAWDGVMGPVAVCAVDPDEVVD